MVSDKPMCATTPEGQDLFADLHSAFAERSTEDYVVRQIQGTGLDYVGQGDSRVVLVDETGQYLQTGNACVVKINKYGDNESNLNEIRNWNNISGDSRQHLLRITDYDDNYRWVVMPYLDTDVTDEMLIELEKTFLDEGWKVRDVSHRNAARVQDRAVLVDYDQPITRIDFGIMSRDERERLIEWKYE